MADRTVAVVVDAVITPYQRKMAQATASTEGFQAATGDATEAVDNFDGSAKGTTGTLQDLGPAAQQAGMALAAVGVATAAAAALSVKAAIDWETAWAGVTKTVDGTQAQMSGLQGELRAMANELPASHAEIASVAEAAGQLGIETEAVAGFTKTMINLGETTNLSADEAATSLARLANVMGTPQDAFDEMGSTIVDLGNNMATTEAEISEMAQRIAGAGKQVGLAESDVLAFGAALSSVGVEAQAGGTAISRVFVTIAEAVEGGGEELEGFADVAGVSAREYATAFEEDAAQATLMFIQGLGEMQASGENVFGTLDDLQLGEIRVRDALLRAAGASGVFTDALDIGSKAWQDNTALTEEAEKRYATLASQLGVLRNQIVDAAIDFGNQLAPAVGKTAEVIGNLVSTWQQLPGPMKTTVSAAGGLVGILSGLAGGALLLAPRIASTADAFGRLATVAPRTHSALSGVGSLLMGPWGAALAAGTIALGMWANSQAEARARVDELTETLDEQTGEISDNTREWVANRLEKEGLLRAADNLGISLSDVTDAALGEEDAVGRVNDGIDRTLERHAAWVDEGRRLTNEMGNEQEAAHRLQSGINNLSGEVEKAKEAHDRKRRATEEAAVSDDELTDSERRLQEALGMTGQSAEETRRVHWLLGNAAGFAGEKADDAAGGFGQLTTDLQRAVEEAGNLQDVLKAQVNPVFGLMSAVEQADDAQRAYTKAVKEHGRGSRQARQAAVEHAKAIANLEAEAVRGDLSFAAFRERLATWVKMGKITEAEAQAIEGKVREARKENERFDGHWRAQLSSPGADKSRRQASDAAGQAERFHGQYQAALRLLGADKVKGVLGRVLEVLRAISSGNWAAVISLTGKFVSGRGDGPGWAVPSAGGSAVARMKAAMAATPGNQYITSTYRSPAHNAAIGGSPTSFHMDASNPAADAGGENLVGLYQTLQAMGGNRELLGPGDPGHGDHVHVAHQGGRATRSGIRPLRSDELDTRIKVGETVLTSDQLQSLRAPTVVVQTQGGGGSRQVDRSVNIGQVNGVSGRDVAREVARQQRIAAVRG